LVPGDWNSRTPLSKGYDRSDGTTAKGSQMTQSVQWIEGSVSKSPARQSTRRLSSLRLLLRYPIFLLAFGPPIFRSNKALAGFDTSQAHADIWSVIQVGWIFALALRAIIRLGTSDSIRIPKEVRNVLRLGGFIGILYLISIGYSPGRAVSAEFTLLYFLTLICVTEFVVDVYSDPPNWIQCLLLLRSISFIAILIILAALAIDPTLVMSVVPEQGIRLLGGPVGNTALLGSMMAIISAYTFLHSLESRTRATIFFLIGLAATLITQWRGGEIALFLSLGILVVQWARLKKRSAQIFVAGLMAFILLAGGVVIAVGGEKIWKVFNRGQDVADVASASGRTEMWTYAFSYCVRNPWGMGYVAGFRYYFTRSFNLAYSADVTHLGNCHNAFVQVLADAGWVALLLYLMMNAGIVSLGWRFAKKHAPVFTAFDVEIRHVLRCALLLLLYCFIDGLDMADFDIPLRQPFYFQFIVVAIILGAATNMIIITRSRNASQAR
jgi:O-antigen ligase